MPRLTKARIVGWLLLFLAAAAAAARAEEGAAATAADTAGPTVTNPLPAETVSVPAAARADQVAAWAAA